MSNRPEIVKVPQDHFHKFHDPELAAAAAIARRYGMKMATQTQVPQSTGIGAPANGPAPASLERSPGAAQPQAQAQKIPFTRASSLAAMQDATLMNLAPGIATQVNLMTNAFLEYIILNVQIVAVNTGTPATVKWGKDAPFNIFGSAGIQLTDPSNQAIITAISGFKLAQLNKYLGDTGCNYDPCKDPNFAMLPTAANNGTGSTAATGGSASFRLVIPIENRRRDALGALTNSAANEVMHLILTPAASFAVGTDQENSVYVGAAPFVSVTLNVQVWQMYWTSPPAVIVSGGTSVPTARTPAGLGTVGYVRAERHTEIAGGGSAPFQLTSVGDVIASINWTLRTTVATNQRDQFAQSATFNAGYPNWPCSTSRSTTSQCWPWARTYGSGRWPDSSTSSTASATRPEPRATWTPGSSASVRTSAVSSTTRRTLTWPTRCSRLRRAPRPRFATRSGARTVRSWKSTFVSCRPRAARRCTRRS